MVWNENLEPNTPAYNFAVDPAIAIRVLAGPGTGKSLICMERQIIPKVQQHICG